MKTKTIKRAVKINSKNLFALCGIALIAVIAIVMAQAEPANVPVGEGAALLTQADSDVLMDELQQSDANEEAFVDQAIQSMNFRKDMSIRDALRFLAAKYRRNIIPSAAVNGKLNVTSLYEVTFEEALDAILGPGYHYDATDAFIRVYTTEEYARFSQDVTRMTSRVYTFNYINATDAVLLITPILSESGKVASVTAAAVDTEAGEGGDTHAMKDTVVVFDFPERLDKISRAMEEVDVQPQQILIEVTILEATLSETTNFGINWSNVAALTNSSFSFTANLANTSADAFTATIGNDKLTAIISAEEGVTDTTVLANPKIMALNKQAGYINIGEERGYTASTTQGQTTTTSVEFLISGTILKFRPFICDDGYIRMEINPELSTGTIQTDVNSTLPLKNITTVKTNIMVKDGKTIVIGGLFKEQLTSTNTQIPIMGDLPIIGNLFKSTSDANIRKELVVLITPHLIKTPEDLLVESAVKQQDVDRIYHGSRKRMNPIARAGLYEDSYAKAVDFYADKKYDKALAELDWIISYRPNALEAVKLREKILAETNPQKLQGQERIMLNKMDAKQDRMWKRK